MLIRPYFPAGLPMLDAIHGAQHAIVIRRLEARSIAYVSFHGGVPSEQRPALIECFRDDPDCRIACP